MQEVHDIAQSYYEAGSGEVKKKAQEFFESMHRDRHDRVSLKDFLEFMKQCGGYTRMRSLDFFNMLNNSGNGTLSFREVITLYYIIKSGRPFCDSCNIFIPGTFYSCVDCFNHPNTSCTFNICHNCKKSGKCTHAHHDRPARFYDNFVLLQAQRDSQLRPTQSKPQEIISDNSIRRRPAAASSIVPRHAAASSIVPRHAAASSIVPRHAAASDSSSTEFANDYISKEWNKVHGQIQCYRPSSSTTTCVARSEATTSASNTHLVLVPATRQPEWWQVAGVAFKALEALVAVGGVLANASACTIL